MCYYLEQELVNLPDNVSSHPGLSVVRCLTIVFCVVFCRSLFYSLVFSLLSIVLSVLRFTASNYSFGIFKPFF